MLFCDFAKILFINNETTYKNHEFVLIIIDNIMREPTTDEVANLTDVQDFNPFNSLKPDTLEKIFSGKIDLNRQKVQLVLSRKSTDKFAKFIDAFSYDNKLNIENKIKSTISNFNKDDNLGYACADLFIQILEEIYYSKTLSVPTSSPSHLKKLPAREVYYDENSGKLHIGDNELDIPKEIAPPTDIDSEEETYVKELLNAYADKLNYRSITKKDLESLPDKLKQNFSDQRINYYRALRVERFIRDSVENGKRHATKWKSETHDYIKDTLWDDYDNGYARLLAVLKKVVDCSTTSVLEDIQNLVGPREKKGVCHLLVNENIFKWVDKND